MITTHGSKTPKHDYLNPSHISNTQKTDSQGEMKKARSGALCVLLSMIDPTICENT